MIRIIKTPSYNKLLADLRRAIKHAWTEAQECTTYEYDTRSFMHRKNHLPREYCIKTDVGTARFTHVNDWMRLRKVMEQAIDYISNVSIAGIPDVKVQRALHLMHYAHRLVTRMMSLLLQYQVWSSRRQTKLLYWVEVRGATEPVPITKGKEPNDLTYFNVDWQPPHHAGYHNRYAIYLMEQVKEKK